MSLNVWIKGRNAQKKRMLFKISFLYVHIHLQLLNSSTKFFFLFVCFTQETNRNSLKNNKGHSVSHQKTFSISHQPNCFIQLFQIHHWARLLTFINPVVTFSYYCTRLMCKLFVSDIERPVYLAESHWLPFSTNTHCFKFPNPQCCTFVLQEKTESVIRPPVASCCPTSLTLTRQVWSGLRETHWLC